MSTGLSLAFGVMKVVNMARVLSWSPPPTSATRCGSTSVSTPILAALIVMFPMAGLGLVCYRLVIARLERIDRA